jgi:hypothetical protein
MLYRVALVITDVSEENIASIIRLTRICELGIAIAVTSNRSTLRHPTLLMMEAARSFETSVLKRPHGVSSQRTAFFLVNAVKT